MAWWIHFLFYNKHYDTLKEGRGFVGLYQVLVRYLHDRFINVVYIILSVLTYLYLFLSVLTFFFARHVPPVFSSIVETLSEPYLGALGVYIIVREIEKRRGYIRSNRKEHFIFFWLLFSIIATLLISFSEYYYANELYKTIVTNTLATIIIRIGMLVR